MKYILKGELTKSVKIKRSEFITHLFCVDDAQMAKERISEISRSHKNASHNCWAYIVGADGEIFHSSDDGEPSGTAGKPILGVLFSKNITNVCVMITRYFGGVKLGISGLIDAYSSVTEEAVETVGLEQLICKVTYSVELAYSLLDSLNYKLNLLNLEIFDTKYSDKITAKVAIPLEIEEDFLNVMNELRIKNDKIED